MEKEFDMSTNEGRLAYAKKHYPIGTKYIPLAKDGNLFTRDVYVSQYDAIYRSNEHNMIKVGDGLIYHKGKWAKIIKEEETVKETKMETQKLSRKGLKEIHSVACSSWKSSLELLGASNPLEDYIELNQDQIDAMFKACTSSQLPIVSKYLKQDDGSVNVTKFKCEIYNGDGRAIIEKRFDGEYAYKSLLLEDVYDWEIKTDSHNKLCLIPTKKK